MARESMRAGVRCLAFVILIAMWACGRGRDSLTLFFRDELVEAPARTVDIAIVAGMPCDDVLSVPHENFGRAAALVRSHVASYPLSLDVAVLEGLPFARPHTIDAVALDANGLVIARACLEVVLDADQSQAIELELLALPSCSKKAGTIDYALVLDASRRVAMTDPDRNAYDALLLAILQPNSIPEGARFSLVSYGGSSRTTDRVVTSTDVASVRDAVDAMKTISEGDSTLFDGIFRGAQLLRANALCGHAPALLVIAASEDTGSMRRFEDARLGIYASTGEKRDDIFLFGLALTEGAYRDLSDLIPKGELGRVVGAASPAAIDAALIEARDAFFASLNK